jgi:holo-[acyl-carrier protein] synthase
VLIGVGIDILQIERVRRSLKRFGRGYLEETCSDEEIARFQAPANLTEEAFYARAFCAKEACAKALGTGIDGAVNWHDILVDQSSSPPTITLKGGAIERLTDITPPGFRSAIAVDVGSRNGLAQAVVMITAAPHG